MSVHHVSSVSLAEWDSVWAEADQVHELVEGVPVVVPGEREPNVFGASRLIIHLHEALGRPVKALPGIEVLIKPDPDPTIRRPDLAVVGPDRESTGYRLAPDRLLLAVEFVSPSTARTDFGDKASEYAAANIPSCLLVDLRDRDRGTLTLLSDPTPRGYRTRFQGTSVSLALAGARVPLTIDDLR